MICSGNCAKLYDILHSLMVFAFSQLSRQVERLLDRIRKHLWLAKMRMCTSQGLLIDGLKASRAAVK